MSSTTQVNNTWAPVTNPYIIGHQVQEEESLPSSPSPSCSKPVNCGCDDHNAKGRILADSTFPIPVDTAFTLLFTESKFFKRSLAELGNTALSFSPWTQLDTQVTGDESVDAGHNQPGQLASEERTVKYTVALSHPLIKSAPTIETQSLIKSSPGELYKVIISAVNQDIPYSDTFSVKSTYCLTRGFHDTETRIIVTSEVLFTCTSWSFKLMRPIIEKNAYEGVTKHVTNLITSLNTYCTRRPSIIGEIMDAEVRSLGGNSNSISSRSGSPYLNRIRIEEPDHKSLHWSRETLITSLTKRAKSNSLSNSLQHHSSQQLLQQQQQPPQLTINSLGKSHSQSTLRVMDLLNSKDDSYPINGSEIKLPLSNSIKLVVATIVILIIANVFLYVQLWNLESTVDQFEKILKPNVTSDQVVIYLPNDDSVTKLHTFLIKTVDTLSKVEYHLQDLGNYIKGLNSSINLG